MRITQGCFSFLPDLDDEQIKAQIEYCLRNGWAIGIEYTDDPHPRNTYLGNVGSSHVRPEGRRRRDDGAERLPQGPSATSTSSSSRSIPRVVSKRCGMSFIVQPAEGRAGLRS